VLLWDERSSDLLVISCIIREEFDLGLGRILLVFEINLTFLCLFLAQTISEGKAGCMRYRAHGIIGFIAHRQKDIYDLATFSNRHRVLKDDDFRGVLPQGGNEQDMEELSPGVLVRRAP
jgi:hypothetical protein